MHVLVVNAGSSSVKFSLFDMVSETAIARGSVERIGLDGTRFCWRSGDDEPETKQVDVTDVSGAVQSIVEVLVNSPRGQTRSALDIDVVGHRVVHGGAEITEPVIVDESAKAVIRSYIDMSPLHNPANLAGIEACERVLPSRPQVAVFDTAFHATIPPHAFLYALPMEYCEGHRIRRYGFHGISHGYVAGEAVRYLAKPACDQRIITCHLGNGCSISAVRGGRCIDTSMGLTPLEGLVMGTRSGDLDPAVVCHLVGRHGLDVSAVQELLNRRSGLFGLAGIDSGDIRDIQRARAAGNRRADTAIQVFVYRIKKYIGAYYAALGGLDALVFTGGIGENAASIRQEVCDGLDGTDSLGIDLDPVANALPGGTAREIQSHRSRAKVLVIPTDEERAIARAVTRLLAA